jgi:uncharacterized protein (DUF1330 family)
MPIQIHRVRLDKAVRAFVEIPCVTPAIARGDYQNSLKTLAEREESNGGGPTAGAIERGGVRRVPATDRGGGARRDAQPAAVRPDGGQARYAEYGAAVAPLLERVGGRIVFAGEPAAALLGDDSWDLVALVEYPSRGAFLEMISSPEYAEIGHLRTEALHRGELHPMDPAAI